MLCAKRVVLTCFGMGFLLKAKATWEWSLDVWLTLQFHAVLNVRWVNVFSRRRDFVPMALCPVLRFRNSCCVIIRWMMFLYVSRVCRHGNLHLKSEEEKLEVGESET